MQKKKIMEKAEEIQKEEIPTSLRPFGAISNTDILK